MTDNGCEVQNFQLSILNFQLLTILTIVFLYFADAASIQACALVAEFCSTIEGTECAISIACHVESYAESILRTVVVAYFLEHIESLGIALLLEEFRSGIDGARLLIGFEGVEYANIS